MIRIGIPTYMSREARQSAPPARERAGTSPDMDAKLEFLSAPESYPNRPDAVTVIETHFAWVFLAGPLAYKVKKAIRFNHNDLRGLATREAVCREEVKLNRRLAADTYLGVVPLTWDGGRLALGGDGRRVEWLVKMRRLDRSRMLDRVAARRRVSDEELAAVMNKLAAFYRRTARAPWSGEQYLAHLAADLDRTAAWLADPLLRLKAPRVERIISGLRAVLSHQPELFSARAEAGRVLDAHGDLKPEHVCLGSDPQIIDCLEFDPGLRLLDSAEEMEFLALECRRLGYPELATRLVGQYEQCCADRPPATVRGFYRGCRALVRARLSAWHLVDGAEADAGRWLRRADWYLSAAESALH